MRLPKISAGLRSTLCLVLFNLALVEHASATPDISVTPLSINFGEVGIGTTISEFITISNVSVVQDEILSVFAVQFADGSSDDFMLFASDVPGSLQPGEFIQVEALYTPTMLGTATAELLVVSNDPLAGLVTVELLGTAVALPEPTTLALLGIGLFVVSSMRRTRGHTFSHVPAQWHGQ